MSLFKNLSEQLSPGGVRNVYDVLVRLMAAAVEDKVIASSPCCRITLPPMPEEEVTPPTVAQVEAMARVDAAVHSGGDRHPAGSGLRIGELLGLRVSDVDFGTGAIRVGRQRLRSGKIGPARPPSPGVPSRLARSSPTRSSRTSPRGPSKKWLFTMEEGEPLNYRRWKTEWNCACRAAAENEAAEREVVSPSSCHTW
ncbi:tyrosine-type recombinase/integrase [Streptomyces sp. NPDC056708]|uniref:tyrosine-type recombinase/integrase n=1 Tax=unclassified Streptomyces TaxID=2593676 RepID=UPI0036C760F5